MPESWREGTRNEHGLLGSSQPPERHSFLRALADRAHGVSGLPAVRSLLLLALRLLGALAPRVRRLRQLHGPPRGSVVLEEPLQHRVLRGGFGRPRLVRFA